MIFKIVIPKRSVWNRYFSNSSPKRTLVKALGTEVLPPGLQCSNSSLQWSKSHTTRRPKNQILQKSKYPTPSNHIARKIKPSRADLRGPKGSCSSNENTSNLVASPDDPVLSHQIFPFCAKDLIWLITERVGQRRMWKNLNMKWGKN